MNMTRSVLAALLVAVVVPAQAGGAAKPAAKPAEKPTEKLVEYDKLVADWTAAMKTYLDANKELMASDAYKEAVAAKDSDKIKELRAAIVRPDAKAFGARALELADQYTGEASLHVLAYAASNFADKDTTKAIAARVEKDFLKSPALGELLENAMSLSRGLGAEEANKLLDRVIAESPHALPKAWAMYWQAQSLQSVQRQKDATDAAKAEAAAKADRLFADAARLAEGTDASERIGAPAFEKERLQIGMQAPDIVGEDVDGVAFKLSDYRGKVVMIDYWGFW